MGEEVRDMGSRIAVPATALATRRCVHIDNGVNTVVRADGNNAIEVSEGVLFQDSWIQIICRSVRLGSVGRSPPTFKMAVVDCNSDAVQPERLEELCVRICEKVLQELYSNKHFGYRKVSLPYLVEEESRFLSTKYLSKCFSNLKLASRISCDEVFHCHPTTETRTAEDDFPRLRDELGARDAKERHGLCEGVKAGPERFGESSRAFTRNALQDGE